MIFITNDRTYLIAVDVETHSIYYVYAWENNDNNGNRQMASILVCNGSVASCINPNYSISFITLTY